MVNSFGHIDIDEASLIGSPQPYTVSDLQLLWAIYRHSNSGTIANDPMYFLTDGPET